MEVREDPKRVAPVLAQVLTPKGDIGKIFWAKGLTGGSKDV